MPADERMLEAVKAGDESAVRALLREDTLAALARDASGVSAIMHAHYRGHTSLAQTLTDAHPSPDVFELAAAGRTDRLAAWLDRAPELARATSADGFTALHFACFFAQPEVARLLLERGADAAARATNATQLMPLHSAAASRQVAIVELLLRAGAPFDAAHQRGFRALHAAAENGDVETARLLLAAGADPEAKSDEGKDAAAFARARGHQVILDLLDSHRPGSGTTS